jgi:hypothetical protein
MQMIMHLYRSYQPRVLYCPSLGWCSWLSRVPHTHEVTSSILVPSIFFLLLSRTTFLCIMLCVCVCVYVCVS